MVRAFSLWSEAVKDKLALARLGNMTAASFANYGAGRPPTLTTLARGIKDSELTIPRALVAPLICGGVAA